MKQYQINNKKAQELSWAFCISVGQILLEPVASTKSYTSISQSLETQ